jgi:uncharacterized membrane protein YkoI
MTSNFWKSARRLLPALALAALASGPFCQAMASNAVPGQREARDMRTIVLAEAGMSLDAAAAMVRQKFGGKVIDAKTINNRGRQIHVIKLLSDQGRVTTVKVDAQSGKIL